MWRYCDYNTELYHHGIKGMKWGVRRSPQQLGHPVSKKRKKSFGKSAGHALGSGLTKIGRGVGSAGKSIGKGVKSGFKKARNERAERIIRSGDPNKIAKKQGSLSDQELSRAVNRTRNTQQLSDMRKNSQSTISKGKNEVERILGDSGKTVLGIIATGVMLRATHKYITRKFGREYADDVMGNSKNTHYLKNVKYAQERIAPNYTTRALKKHRKNPVTKALKAKHDYSDYVSDVPLLTGPSLKGRYLKGEGIRKLTKNATKGRYKAGNIKRFSKPVKSYKDRVKWKMK